MFVYTAKPNPLKEGRAKTEAYIDSERRPDSRFCAKCFRGASGLILQNLQRDCGVGEFYYLLPHISDRISE